MNYNEIKFKINQNYYSDIGQINNRLFVGKNTAEIAKVYIDIQYMFTNKKKEKLKNTYELLSFNPESLKVIDDAFYSYIRKSGEEIYRNKEISKEPIKFVTQLMDLKKEMDNLVEDCFENNPQFQDTKNKAFKNFMNKDFYAKQISNYIGFCMKSGFKGKSDDEIEKNFNKIIGLFKLLNSKLVFQIEENKRMSDRIIKGAFISINHEKKLISKLKEALSVNFVCKILRMMHDFHQN